MDETLSNDDEIVSRRQLDFLVCHLFHNVYRCNPSSVEVCGEHTTIMNQCLVTN